jgi:1,4-dihydroxy-2-naphthoate octaprenyltransferase
MTSETVTTASKKKLWLAAIKPPMYSVAIIPIIMGTAIAYQETGKFSAPIFWTFILSAILILAWLNLSNDVFDADTGIDVNKAHSIVNLTGNRSLIFWLSNLFLLLGIVGICAISYWCGDWIILEIVALCCFLGYTYQGPPFRLGYQGLGEIICFFTFGPLAIEAAYYSQTQAFSFSSLAASIIIGITTSIILFCSHFHQVADDLKAGKKSPIVRLGTLNGSKILTAVTVLVYILTVIFVIFQVSPLPTLLIFLSLPFAWQLVNHVSQNHAQPERVSNCKFIAVNLHFFSGILLALGYFLAPHP